jgi:hypothetical protein
VRIGPRPCESTCASHPAGLRLVTCSRRSWAVSAVPLSVRRLAAFEWAVAYSEKAAGVSGADVVTRPAIFVVGGKVFTGTVALRKPWRATRKRELLCHGWLGTPVERSVNGVGTFGRHKVGLNARRGGAQRGQISVRAIRNATGSRGKSRGQAAFGANEDNRKSGHGRKVAGIESRAGKRLAAITTSLVHSKESVGQLVSYAVVDLEGGPCNIAASVGGQVHAQRVSGGESIVYGG